MRFVRGQFRNVGRLVSGLRGLRCGSLLVIQEVFEFLAAKFAIGWCVFLQTVNQGEPVSAFSAALAAGMTRIVNLVTHIVLGHAFWVTKLLKSVASLTLFDFPSVL